MDKMTVYEKKAKTKKHKFSFLPTVTLILVIAGFAYASYFSYDYAVMRQNVYTENYEVEINQQNAIEVVIPQGASTKEIGKLLHDLRLIDSVFLFQALSNVNGYDGLYRSGTHYLNYNMEYEDIMIILSSKPEIVKVTIPEGYTVNQIKKRLLEKGLIDEEEFDWTIKNISLEEYETIKIEDKGHLRDVKLEGYLFPDTYEFDKNAGEEYIIRKMLSRFNEIIDEKIINAAKERNLSIDELIILASIVEKETAYYDERRKIAGVFDNKLKSEELDLKKLESLATINYLFEREGKERKEYLTKEDKSINNPYNTYLYRGLPPGPISCPGIVSIEAVLYPEENEYYYFILRNNESGRHIFFETNREYQQALENLEGTDNVY